MAAAGMRRLLDLLVSHTGGQAAAARAVGVDPATMSRWLSGEVEPRPTVEQTTAIVAALGIPWTQAVEIVYGVHIGVAEALEADQLLTDQLRAHLLRQYQILSEFAALERGDNGSS